MDIMHQEIETTHTSSQEVEEQEVKRSWVELPPDIMSLILLKLGTIDILANAQWVCTAWWKLSKQPHLFCSIHVEEVKILFGCSIPLYTAYKRSDQLAREAIDRSCGQLVEFSVREIANAGLLQYMSDKSGSLRCIRLVSCYRLVGHGLIELAKKLPQLEDFEIIDFSYITEDVIEAYGRFCPRLKSCRLNYVNYPTENGFHSVVMAIAQNMPELRSLHLFGCRLTDDGLKAVLDGCPHLESLDLRQCFDLKFAGDLKVRCGNIKVLRLPNDPTDDFEYEIQCYPTHDFSYSDSYSGSDDRYPTHDFSDSKNSCPDHEYSGSDDCYPTHDFSDSKNSYPDHEYSGSDDCYPTLDFCDSDSYSDDDSGSEDRYPTHDVSESDSYSDDEYSGSSEKYSGSGDHYATHDFSDYYSDGNNDYDYDGNDYDFDEYYGYDDYDEYYGYDDNDYDYD